MLLETENFVALEMTSDDNADATLSENKNEAEDSLRTVECLRGRLQAERLASRNATEEAEQFRIKISEKLQILEVEKQLKEEEKSRKRAEKKLKLLVNKVESIQEFKKLDVKSPKGPWDLCISCTTEEKSSISSNENQIEDCLTTSEGEEVISEKSSQMNRNSTSNSADGEDDVDNSTAIVSVEMPKKKEIIDPEVIDERVKQVLESLKRAKEQLQSSMERRRISISISIIT